MLIIVASVAFVPVNNCVVTFVGEVTAVITGTAGGIVSSVIEVVAAVLALPTASSAVTLKLFTPSIRFTVTCQVVVVGKVTPVVLVLTLRTDASVAFVPVRSCVVTLVGEVTAFITGTVGGIVSKVIKVVAAVLALPTESYAVTLKLFAPSDKFTVVVNVVEPSVIAE